jgi:hypothetical protein
MRFLHSQDEAMSLTRSVDAYCERTDAGFWSEPANALTNAAFLLAAWLLWREVERLRRQAARPPASIAALPALLALVGACSFLFHTLATVWAGPADQLSILLFGCVFLYAFLRHPAGLATGTALAGAALFSAVSYLTPGYLPAGFLNQSGAYFPYLAGLAGITAWMWWKGRAQWRSFGVGIALFCGSLALRTVDLTVCGRFPIGTHFLWHLLNAAILFALSRALARAALRPAPLASGTC